MTQPEHALQSREQAIGNLEQVIGRLPDTIRNDYMHEQSRTHGDLTELLMAKIPQSVTQVISGLLLSSYVSPYTKLLLPIRALGPYEPIQVTWNELNFDAGLAEQVEVEGLARLYTHNKTKRGARAVRRGVAVKTEHGFYMTPEGREEWKYQIEQLATIVQRTNDYDVMMTLLQTPMRDSRHANQLGGPTNVYGARPTASFMERLKLEVDWFGIVNKSEDSKGFVNLCNSMRTVMKKNGVDPDAMVIPPNMLGYYMQAADLWNHDSAGPSNQANREAASDLGNENGIRTQTFQGMKLVDTHVARMTEGERESPNDLLTVPKQIGEFYPMLTQNAHSESAHFNHFQTRNRDIRIFNEEHGRIQTVRYRDCIKHCLRWVSDKDGHLDPYSHGPVPSDMFKWGPEGSNICDMWAEMTSDSLSEESLHNVVRSVVSKLNGDLVMELNKSIEKYIALADRDQPLTLKGDQGQDVPADDSDDYNNLRQAWTDRVWSDIDNNLVKFVLCGLESEQGDYTAKVQQFLYTKFTVFDEDEDIETKVSWAWAIAPRNAERHMDWINCIKKLSHVEKVVAYMFLQSNITRENMSSWARKDFYLPVDFLLCRPYMTYDVSSAIVMKAGTDTGETLIGDQKFELTSNIGDRTMYGNYFYYSKAIVKKDRNVIVAPNVFIQGYVKGNNCTFITSDDVEKIREYSGLLDGTRSILALMIPVNDQVDSVNAIDIRGQRDGMTLRQDSKYFYKSAPYYNSHLGIDSIGVDDPVTSWVDYEEVTMQANSICFLGHTETVDGHVLYRNTGHLGQYTYDGVQMSRRAGHYAKVNPMLAR